MRRHFLQKISSDPGAQKRLQIYFLLFVVSLVYLRSIFGDFISLDDNVLAERLNRSDQVNFLPLFFGEQSGALYYRPLLISTYYLEKLFLQVNPLVMRFDNVLLQLANTFFTYLVVEKIFILKKRVPGWWPLLFALLFGLHPLATESVNWISGRTDLLAGFFILSSTWFLLKYHQNRSGLVLCATFFAALCAMLSKEVAVAFVPGLFLLWWTNPSSQQSQVVGKGRFWRVVGICVGVVLGLSSLIYMRSLVVAGSHSGISRTVHMITDDFTHSAMLFFRLFGFYFKKMIAPLPLNLAIFVVDPLYDLLGIIVVFTLIWLFLRNRFSSDFFVVAGLLLLPAYPISFGQIAWSPYAERYAYVAMAFVLFGIAALIADHLYKVTYQKTVGFVMIALVVCFAPATFARNGLWQSSLPLWEDTAQKSPYSGTVRNGYGLALYTVGDFAGAQKQFDLARSGFGYNYSPKSGLVYGKLLFATGQHAEAVAAWREAIVKTREPSLMLLSEVLTQCGRSEYMIHLCGGFEPVNEEFSLLYELSSDPVWLVKWADFSSKAGHAEQAGSLYRQAQSSLSPSHPLQERVREALDL